MAEISKDEGSWLEYLDSRPVIVAIAGPNGAGKSTFYEVYLKSSGLHYLNADEIARELGVDPYEAAAITASFRTEFVEQRESFIFETVFSDPVSDKLNFLKEAAKSGYAVVLCFIGLTNAQLSEERVLMRVSQGGHDVPPEKLTERFPRTLRNLQTAMRELPCVAIFDNSDLRQPFRHVATYVEGHEVGMRAPIPAWVTELL
jgi:predicted ABC-type ATPase